MDFWTTWWYAAAPWILAMAVAGVMFCVFLAILYYFRDEDHPKGIDR